MVTISVIMPTYNIEKHVTKAIESLLEQTYKQFQLIIVDDGSTDHTYEICKRFKEQDNRIQIIQSQHKGVSAARNEGLSIATGEYVYFMDSDDYIEKTAFEYLVQKIEDYNSDIIIFGYFVMVEQDDKELCSIKTYINTDRYYQNFREHGDSLLELWNKSLMYNVWNKLFKREIIKEKKLSFDEKLSYGEDTEFINQYLLNSKDIFVGQEMLYHYVKERTDSLTSKYIKDWFPIRVEEYNRLYMFFKQINMLTNETDEYLARRFIMRVYGCIQNECSKNNSANVKEKIHRINEMISHPLTVESIKKMQYTSFKMRVILIPLKFQSVIATYLVALGITVIREVTPGVYLRARQSR